MKDIAKTSIKGRLIIALEKESLSKTKAGELLGVKPQYLSMVLSPSQWNKFPESTWDILQKWVNSGQTLEKYATNHGKTVVEKKATKRKLFVEDKSDYAPEVPMITLAHYKEQTDKANAEIRRLTKENENLAELIDNSDTELPSVVESTCNSHKVCIDLEVNLIINGKKIEIK